MVLVMFPPPFNGTSNPHMAYEHGNKYETVNPQRRGGGKVWRIGRTGGSGDFTIHGFIPQPSGTGPRHMAILGASTSFASSQLINGGRSCIPDDTIYLLHETAHLLTAQVIPTPTPPSPPEFLANATTVPDNLPAGGTYAAAELLLSPTSLEYPHPYLYASNRNIGGTPDPRGDSMAIFDPISKPELALVKRVFTGLVEIRGMELGIGEVGGELFGRNGGGERGNGDLQADRWREGFGGGCEKFECGAEDVGGYAGCTLKVGLDTRAEAKDSIMYRKRRTTCFTKPTRVVNRRL
ncbi:Isomerase YbhE [Mycena sanguinolenta]|uniref:Isomerase YbhE n=1 Tax=Mycena sanguinolenta TaxID=230812 RepID=A0A8H6X4F2_9AGAR|nr:Isomerase YbhE [Mycena sanguinolenta]